MENRFWQLLDQLKDGEYKTAAALGKALHISDKTAHNLIRDCNAVIRDNGAEIESKQKYGCHLIVRDAAQWSAFLRRGGQGTQIPHSADERMYYLLNYLLSHNHYVKLTDLGEELFISPQTLSAVLKRVEEALAPSHIRIDRKPYHGIRALGAEFDKRCCLIRYFCGDSEAFRRNFDVQEEELGRVFNALMSILPAHQIRLTEVALQNMAAYLYLSYMRMQADFWVTAPPENEKIIRQSKEFAAATAVWAALLADKTMVITDPELCYTSVYMAGKRNVGSGFRSNFVITEHTDYLTMRMLESIYTTFHIELRDNLNLRMLLNQHLQPLDIRLRYGIPAENPILQDIKRDYFMAYTMADQAAVVLREHYQTAIPEVEVGWLALIFQMAIENQATTAKLNVLIVCASGKASSYLLLSKFQREFGAYIRAIDCCTIFELEHRSLAGVDYIFTTVPIPVQVDVPILEIHDFIQHYELQSIKKVFHAQNMRFLQQFYQQKYFYTGLTGATCEDVLTQLCARLGQDAKLPDAFLPAVLKREGLGATDYGNLVAIPHPYEIMTEENVVAVGVLDKPIRWHTNPVQLVILVSFSPEENSHVPAFYNVTTQFITNETAVQSLLADPRYEKLMELLYGMNFEGTN